MKSIPMRFMKTPSRKTAYPSSCKVLWRTHGTNIIVQRFIHNTAHEEALCTQLLPCSRSRFSFLTSSVAHSVAASSNIYAALCRCMPAVSLCVALCVFSYSLCCAPLLSIRQSTHGTDPTSSRQPPLPHTLPLRGSDSEFDCLHDPILLNVRHHPHHTQCHLYRSCIGALLLFPTYTHTHPSGVYDVQYVILKMSVEEKRRDEEDRTKNKEGKERKGKRKRHKYVIGVKARPSTNRQAVPCTELTSATDQYMLLSVIYN